MMVAADVPVGTGVRLGIVGDGVIEGPREVAVGFTPAVAVLVGGGSWLGFVAVGWTNGVLVLVAIGGGWDVDVAGSGIGGG